MAMITTVQQHILQQQQEMLKSTGREATGTFSWLLSGITLAAKMVEAKIRSAGLSDVLGAFGAENVQGEQQQKLDVYANQALLHCLGLRDSVAALVSEEDEEPVTFNRDPETGKYIIVFDPLDGSSNIDVNVSIGTIFSILQRRDDVLPTDGPLPHVLQQGMNQVCAGYVVYGSSTVMAYTTGNGVHMFTLDPSFGAFVLSQEHVTMPVSGKTYSINEAYRNTVPDGIQKYLDWAKTKEAGGYSSRYIGSLVADFHRTLIKGGVFLYPPTTKAPEGKLRLMYEANPIAFLAEQAGGVATDGKQRILEKRPKSLHERTPLIVGSKVEVDHVLKFWKA
jgi:fructose-1,6-bisphosphatase I